MALSAAQLALQEGDSQITELWMNLAAEYITQAVIEQFVLNEKVQSDLIDIAFAWGFDEDCTAEVGTDDFLINAMFLNNETETTNPTWVTICSECKRAVSFEYNLTLG